MSIATRILSRSPNDLLFQMMMAKQKTVTNMTKRCRYISDDYCEMTYLFSDKSSLTFTTNNAMQPNKVMSHA